MTESENMPVATRDPEADQKSRTRGGALAAIALLLAVLALIGLAYLGWRGWQFERSLSAGGTHSQQVIAQLRQQMQSLQQSVSESRQGDASLRQRLGDAESVNRSLRQEVLGLSERTDHLEDAVANLADKRLSGHDAMLLDEAEMLLRTGMQRYRLFNDAEGAGAAYKLADQALADVRDPALAGVRQSINAEREALAAEHPAARSSAMDTLSALRAQLPRLPLKPLDTPQTASGERPPLQRVWHALSGLIHIERDTSAPMTLADARLARELASLDLAQAEAALLAFDDDAYRMALKRADANLAAHFDAGNADVRQARASLARLLRTASANETPAQLGAALQELRNLRSVQALAPAAATTAAPASSS